MIDLEFDFNANDMVLSAGDFDGINICSLQNGTLLFSKSAASLLYPEYGIGFEEFYPNLPSYEFGRVQNKAERQMKNDGAFYVRVTILPTDDNKVHDVEIKVKYRGE